MRLATIPPFCMSKYMLLNQYQLVLPECFRNEGYAETVYDMRKPGRDDFIILDNGAAEGNAWHPQALVAVGREFQVDEIVIPDMLCNKDGTLDLLEHFIKETSSADRSAFGWMAVVQGETWNHFLDCLDVYASMDFVQTIGIPRHMLQTLGQNNARINMAKYINSEYPDRFEIHLLGSSTQWLMEPKVAKEECPYIRGMDTSLPWYAAHNTIEIDTQEGVTIARPEGYFDMPPFEFPIGLLEYNLRILKGWLYG